ncbi:MAG TPA: RNA polymerase sigma factor [Vicinamibacterales bacterium]|nr:RNA polymerase sigma factor [Vicinamibacterales bacterium]
MENSSQASSLAQIAEELSRPLLQYLRRYSGDPEVAEDLLQETLIRIGRGLPGFEGRSQLKTWAFSIATRVAADYFRRPANRAKIVDLAETDEPADSDQSVEAQLVVDEMNSCVRQVIDSLPEDYRAALVLHDLEGLTAEQTAEISGCSLPTAKIRIHRARMRLADALHEACDFYRDGDNVLRCDRKTDRDAGDAKPLRLVSRAKRPRSE